MDRDRNRLSFHPRIEDHPKNVVNAQGIIFGLFHRDWNPPWIVHPCWTPSIEVERVNPPYCKCTFLRGMKDSLFIWSIIERRIPDNNFKRRCCASILLHIQCFPKRNDKFINMRPERWIAVVSTTVPPLSCWSPFWSHTRNMCFLQPASLLYH